MPTPPSKPAARLAALPARAAGAILAAGLLAGGATAQVAPPGAPPPAVTVAPVETGSVAPSAEFVGRIESVATFEARPRVEGTVQQVAFQEGADVAEGQLLYVIDPAPYEAQRTAARAQLARAQAQLREAEQAAARAEALGARGNVAEATLEQARAAQASAEADVLAAQAQLQQAELNLSYTRITSPIAGRIGATAITPGNLVTPQTGVLATVIRLDPIRVTFAVSDRQVLQIMQETGASAPAELVERFVPTLRLATGDLYGHPGRVEFLDNRVDPRTGTIQVRALFPNPNRLLLPGQYASVMVRPERVARSPVVPVSAVQRDREGAYVLVLGPGNVVQPRRLTLGAQSGGVFAVEQGLAAGETIVVEGQQKARAGAPVTPVPAQPPSTAAAGATEGTQAGPAATGGAGPQSPPGALGNAETANPPANPQQDGTGTGSGTSGGAQPGGGSGPGTGGAGGAGGGTGGSGSSGGAG
ncbi:efflux RND transporter periplasmic adaptor subunit [Arenibaculum pallidiluteum]|uniref:efflux RND transporter periplasmic adaptor subunit n=1 Tax=Arenibaculum pallidiluteum TaxID=2812559 RepID=UPI001A979395|nr:efflux RND transporter periplasmic adaptor subunit [Arenibaculum pallidiluteum]